MVPKPASWWGRNVGRREREREGERERAENKRGEALKGERKCTLWINKGMGNWKIEMTSKSKVCA
jgi:hypothetical protein